MLIPVIHIKKIHKPKSEQNNMEHYSESTIAFLKNREELYKTHPYYYHMPETPFSSDFVR